LGRSTALDLACAAVARVVPRFLPVADASALAIAVATARVCADPGIS